MHYFHEVRVVCVLGNRDCFSAGKWKFLDLSILQFPPKTTHLIIFSTIPFDYITTQVPLRAGLHIF
jgi:hypothetical protein